ncbi:hypothetical protein BGZ99_007734 [Dissophora globulifera]|uniref:CID domain-containing protein n=1 Tax=Dissophora globulifera TaxID=979702 RepID=A0A9P6UQM1_9FUNG|nr:hypothetical protein BGZ99_007734 [Dissophora globulifera]
MQTPGVQLALDALVQQSRDLAPSDVRDFMDHLELLMKDCSQANIQACQLIAGKTWVVHHCQNPQQYDLLTRAMVAIAISRLAFIEKLHITFFLFMKCKLDSERKQQPWIKDTLFPHLVPLLRVAYYFPGVDDTQRQRVMKVLEIWRNKEYFPAHVMEAMEMNVRRPPLLPPPLAGGPPGSNPTPPPANPHGLPHQLPFHQHHQHRQHQYPHHPPPMHQQQYSPHLLQQQQYGQPNNTPSSPPQPIFHPQSPFLQQQQQQQQQLPYQQPPVPGSFYSMQPAPIQADVDYYEPLPAYVSVPLQKNELKTESVLSSIKEFLSEDAATLETVTPVANIKDEGWHEGYLDEFYKKMAEKRKRAFSKDPQPRRSRQRNREVFVPIQKTVAVILTIPFTVLVSVSVSVSHSFKEPISI